MGRVDAGWAIGGEVIESYRFDAFGQPTTTYAGGSFNNRFKFTGREYQAAFGIYEYRNRAYHPGLGRFLSEDPVGFAAGDSNMFRYCGGDPVNRRDSFGLHEENSDAPATYYENEGMDSGSSSSGTFEYDGQDSFGELIDRVVLDLIQQEANNSAQGNGSSPGGGTVSNPGISLQGGVDRGSTSSSFGPNLGGNGLLGNVDSHGSDGHGDRIDGMLREIGVFAVAAGNAYARTVNFLAGVGPEVTFYGPGSIDVGQMRGSAFARDTIQAFKDAGSPESGIQRNGGDGIFNPFAPSVLLNPTRQFVGTYNAAVDPIGNGQIVVILQNQTSMHSAGYKSLPPWSRSDFGPGGTVTQYYWWIEDSP